ncbi:hypothetical protein A2U01_0020838 [Trifolium medium]|uniref:Uncharacterized protein n=1 Tax=Trifolium medium TaxID=97028 RepID=A0A392NKB3_9FABA|nr:hypothetical protein [Trifolium medium]
MDGVIKSDNSSVEMQDDRIKKGIEKEGPVRMFAAEKMTVAVMCIAKICNHPQGR